MSQVICVNCGLGLDSLSVECPRCAQATEPKINKSRKVAIAFALIFPLGGHWFYIGNVKRGFIYILAAPIGWFLSFFEAFKMMRMSDKEFMEALPKWRQ